MSLVHELTVLPLALVNSAILVYEFSVSRSFSVKPVTNVVVTIGVYKSSEAIVDVVPELALVNDLVNFLTHSGNFAISAELTDNILVVLALAECQSLVDRLLGVRYDIFQLQRSKLIPFVLYCFQSYTVRIMGVDHIEVLLKNWCLPESCRGIASRAGCHGHIERLSFLLQDWRDIPIVKFYEEHDLVVAVRIFWEYGSVIS